MSRFETAYDQPLRCVECDHEWSAVVRIDTLAGVAVTSCPECGKTQEPVRAGA
jgi:transcription elongation factor Elf1